jgi:hypothetical protein
MLIGFTVQPATAKIIVYDRITSVNQPVFLKVQTRGKFFAEGGQRVTLALDDEKTFNLMTGGDGYGYVKYTPSTAGRYKIRVVPDDGSTSAILLVVAPVDRIILIEIEMLLKSGILTPEQKESARQVLGSLSRDYHLVYTTRFLGAPSAKQLLTSMKFPVSLTLEGSIPNIYKQLSDSNLKVGAIIGSAGSFAGSIQDSTLRLTFDQTEKGTTVEDWNQIQKILSDKQHP